jgi:hypothetical protein
MMLERMIYRLFNDKTRHFIKSRDLIWFDKDYEKWVSKNLDNVSEFSDPIGDDDSDATTNILISDKTVLKTKLDPSKMKVYKKRSD